jgi:hypothetical protein
VLFRRSGLLNFSLLTSSATITQVGSPAGVVFSHYIAHFVKLLGRNWQHLSGDANDYPLQVHGERGSFLRLLGVLGQAAWPRNWQYLSGDWADYPLQVHGERGNFLR